jgi:hypothetical protein
MSGFYWWIELQEAVEPVLQDVEIQRLASLFG